MSSAGRHGQDRVLVVEDEVVARDQLVRALSREGYAVTWAADADAAFDALTGEVPELVVIDMTLPDLPGLELLYAIRQRYTADVLPVFMTGTGAEMADIIAALQLGANDFATKPVYFPVVMRRVAAVLAHRHALARAERLGERLAFFTTELAALTSVHRPDGTFVDASDPLLALLGLTFGQATTLRLHDLLHADDASGIGRMSGVPDTYRLVARVHVGAGYQWTEITTNAVRQSSEGWVTEVQAVWRDVSTIVQVAEGKATPDRAPSTRVSFAFAAPEPPGRLVSHALLAAADDGDDEPALRAGAAPVGVARDVGRGPVVVPGVPAEVRAAVLAQMARPEG